MEDLDMNIYELEVKFYKKYNLSKEIIEKAQF